MSEELAIEQLIDREVFVGGKLVGVIKGQRFSPRKEHVKSLRIDVVSDVAQEYMRKPAFTAPLAKELIHSLQPDGFIRISKSMRENCSAGGETLFELMRDFMPPMRWLEELL